MPGGGARRNHRPARRIDLPHHLVARPGPAGDREQRSAARSRVAADRCAYSRRARSGAFLMAKDKPRLFLDADGVLADFDLAACELLGMKPKEFIARHGRGAFWGRLAKARNFYGTLPEMTDARV